METMHNIYEFKNYVYAQYAPFYDKYKGHKFIISGQHPEEENSTIKHVALTCLTDINLIVDGYVHLSDLVEVDVNGIDVEDLLCNILSQEIENEMKDTYGETSIEYNNRLIKQFVDMLDKE